MSGEGAGRGALAPPSPHPPFPPSRSSSPLRPPAFPPASTLLLALAQARVAISGMPAAHFTVASSVAAASLAVRGRRTCCASLLEDLLRRPHRGLSQASTECYTDIAGESAVRRCVAAPWVPPIQALR